VHTLPADCQEHFARFAAGPAQVTLRALADVEGHLGETHLASDGRGLYLYSRRVGQPVRPMHWPLGDLHGADIHEDVSFARLRLKLAEADYSLKFALTSRADLEDFIRVWQCVYASHASNSHHATLPPIDDAVTVADAPPPGLATVPAGELTPILAFSATLYYLMEADGAVDSDEREMVERIIGDRALGERARAWLRTHGGEALMDTLGQLLNRDQALCLMANLLEVAMVDGLLRSREQHLLERAQLALGLTEHDYHAIYDVLLIKNNLAVFTAQR